MNYENKDTDSTLSLEVRLLIDRLCDLAESTLRQRKQVDWSQLFGQVDPIYWSLFIESLVPQIKQFAGSERPSAVLALFPKTDPLIIGLVQDYCEQTVAPEPNSLITVFGPRPFVDDEVQELPTEIDHFKIIRLIGRGGFGLVLLAHDQHLDREVVIKIPRKRSFESDHDVSSFLGEAKKIALLEHPGIVRIHHVGVWQNRPYLVQQYVAGGDLKQALLNREFTYQRIAKLIADVAETVAFAHRMRIVHRDLKPANILLDEKEKPLVADFGLAIHESEQFGKGGIVAGTAHYMAPEQLRGEIHRLDARTDLWSLGVCMYLMLTKELPFQADDSAALRVQVSQQPCRPPRQLNPDIPWELERICLKCLSKRMDDRYGTGIDLASDLRAWLTTADIVVQEQKNSTTRKPIRHHAEQSLETVEGLHHFHPETKQTLVPKGLLAFDQNDHDFFLAMVPGPRTKRGIPEQLSFWVDRIATENIDQPFCVGLIYGPSGCGKSSFVKAGLLPLLPHDIAIVYVEATDTDTEVRLLAGLRQLFPDIPRDQDLPMILSQLRQGKWLGKYRKVLVVFDQFEQWLHVNEPSMSSQLIEGMRHCDGDRLQAILLARDDFWMKVSRFFQELEIPLEERRNYQPLYLFDLEHAKNVLADFGRAYRRLPAPTEMEAQHYKFVGEAVDKLAENGKVICIHLVLLAETLKERDWTLASLRSIGNLNQIGVLFLEQQFSLPSSNPSHRLLLSGISNTLGFLLPVDEANIKARFRERSQIAEASGYPLGSKEFIGMMNILEKNLRLISAVDPDLGSPIAETSDQEKRYYQLSHDFLVPSVREWLDNLQRQSPAGRAKARLHALANSFANSQDKRYIPSFWEFVEIARFVKRRECSTEANNLYRKTLKRYAVQAALAATFVLILLGAWQWNRRWGQRQVAMVKVDQWLHARPEELNLASTLITEQPSQSITAIRSLLARPSVSNAENTRLLIGLALVDAVDAKQFAQLINYVPVCEYGEIRTLRLAMENRWDAAVPALQGAFEKADEPTQQIKLSLVLFHLGQPKALLNSLDCNASLTRSLLAVDGIATDSDEFEHYIEFLRDQLGNKEQHDLLANMVKGLALRSSVVGNPRIRSSWSELCQLYFKDSPSGPMHSAAKFALSKMEVDVTELLKLGTDRRENVPGNRDWYLTSAGLTMIRIPANGKKIPKESENNEFVLSLYPGEQISDFWISSTEMPTRLYHQYTKESQNDSIDAADDGFERKEGDKPIANIRLVEALRFCNWLSDQEGLERCYIESDEPFELQGDEKTAFGEAAASLVMDQLKQWSIRSESDGYRLPSVGETYFLPYGTLPPEFPSTEIARKLLSQYCWYAENTDPLALQPVGQLMPDRFGLFDSIGNAAEWAVDSRFPMVRLENRVTVDSYIAPISKIEQRNLTYTMLWVPGKNTSFRVARSVKPQD